MPSPITQQARYWRDAGFCTLASGMTGTGLQVLRRLAGHTVRLKRCVRAGVVGLVSALAAGAAGLLLPFPSADSPGGLAADWVKALPCFRGLAVTPCARMYFSNVGSLTGIPALVNTLAST